MILYQVKLLSKSLEPFSNNDPDRDFKYAGETGIICAVDGQPIYRKTFFVADANAEDVLIAHTNGDAIREANGQNTAVKLDKVTPAEAFGIDNEEAETEKVSDDVEETVAEKEEVLEEETFEL